MKKIGLIFMAALLGCIVSCQMQEMDSGVIGIDRLTAVTEGQPLTRTALSEGDGVSSVLWSAGDKIDVFIDGAQRASMFALTAGAGTRQGEFTGEGRGNDYVACYPAGKLTKSGSNKFQIQLPFEQEYQESGFDPMAFPMIAVSSTSELQFRNLMSILRLSITGKNRVTGIVFRPLDSSIKVSGSAVINPSDNSLQMSGQGTCDSLVMNIGSVQLSESNPSFFYLALPPQTYKDGFSVRVYSGAKYMDVFYSEDFTMVRSRMHKAAPFAFEPNSEGVEAQVSLEGSGTENDPFLIRTVEDLLCMREMVNNGKNIGAVAATDAYYKLLADLDLSSVCGSKIGKNWTPIGNEQNQLNFNFDGQGHTISGLYSKTKQTSGVMGLFGYMKTGTISKLTVRGSVEDTNGASGALLVGSMVEGNIIQCVAEGSVKGYSYVAGLVGGYQLHPGETTISHCVNRADVASTSDMGGCAAGIVSYLAGRVVHCINEGKISGPFAVAGIAADIEDGGVYHCTNHGEIVGSVDWVGGIVGRSTGASVANCLNTGNVGGGEAVGGIVGTGESNAKVWNCVNRGVVSGTARIGGVIGLASDGAKVSNCVNLGAVTATGNPGAGAICGSDQEAKEISQCYWLFDSAAGVGMQTGIAEDGRHSSGLAALTVNQMKNLEETAADLYSTTVNSYNLVLNALNAWAFSHSSSIGQQHLQGWLADGTDGYPTLSGLDAQKPGQEQPTLSVSTTVVELDKAGSCEFQIDVTSSKEYEIITPEWITPGEITEYATDPYTHTHTFRVTANNQSTYRTGEISFRIMEWKDIKVTVRQIYARLIVEATEIKFPGDGGYYFLEINSTVNWSITADSWCHPEQSNGVGSTAVLIKADPNAGTSIRQSTLTVSSEDGSLASHIMVYQSGKREEKVGDWTTLPFVHQSVFMRFTATWCIWCPRMHRSLEQAQELYPGHIQHLAIHAPDSDLAFEKATELRNLYKFAGYPTGFVDGRMRIESGEVDIVAPRIVEAVQETEETYGTASGIGISSSISGREVTIDLDVYLKQSGEYKLTVFLVEDNIHNQQQDNIGYHPDFVHNGVARMAVSDVFGDSFQVSSPNTAKYFQYVVNVPHYYKLQNMRVFAYVSREFGSRPIIHSADYGNNYIDNCATAPLGSKWLVALEGDVAGGEGGTNEGVTPGGEIEL